MYSRKMSGNTECEMNFPLNIAFYDFYPHLPKRIFGLKSAEKEGHFIGTKASRDWLERKRRINEIVAI